MPNAKTAVVNNLTKEVSCSSWGRWH